MTGGYKNSSQIDLDNIFSLRATVDPSANATGYLLLLLFYYYEYYYECISKLDILPAFPNIAAVTSHIILLCLIKL